MFAGRFHASRYVFDYPASFARLSAEWQLSDAVALSAAQDLRWQKKNAERESDRFGSSGQLAIQLTPAGLNGVELAVFVENLWDDDFEVFPGQPVAGRRVAASTSLAW
jgi:hypothetical protein